MNSLYVVGTPIGNLEDVSLRALRVLKEVNLILCEDTRVTKRLLERYAITTPVESYPADFPRSGGGVYKVSKVHKVIKYLEEGKNVALVSDAGTPGISDPGARLIEKIRTHLNLSTSDVDGERCGIIKIEAVPGPSALTAALSVAGVPASEFLFLGFLPHKKGRETLFKEVAASKRTVIFYESPHRILKTLKSLQKHLGSTRQNPEVEPKEKMVTVCRELTKIHEEVISGTPEELLKYFETNPDKVRGEFVALVPS